MILFLMNLHVGLFGIMVGVRVAILLTARRRGTVVNPIVGMLADRTKTRWRNWSPYNQSHRVVIHVAETAKKMAATCGKLV